MRSINIFTGLDSDTAFELTDNTKYIDGRNFRLEIDNTNSNIHIVTGKGPRRLIYSDTHKIVNITKVSNAIVFFLSPMGTGRTHYVYRFTIDEINDLINSPNGPFKFEDIDNYNKVLEGDDLQFGDLITTVVNIENDSTHNVYFVSATTDAPVRKINVLKKYGTLSNPDIINLFTNKNISRPTIENIGNGSLKSGQYRYVYQVFELNGSESAFCTPSQPVNISKSSTQVKNNQFFGSDPEENCGKSITIKINGQSGQYARIVRMYWSDIVNLPICTIVYEDKITSSSFVFTDYGNTNYGNISIEEIATSYVNLSARTIASHKNYLFLGNINEFTFDVDIDTRAYRKNKFGNIVLYKNNSQVYNSSNIPTNIDIINEAYNPLNDLNLVPFSDVDISDIANKVCIYKDHVNKIYGGVGNVVSYEIKTGTYKFSSNINLIDTWGEDEYKAGYDYFFKVDMNDSESPLKAQAGYQRDEIYRFGIEFYNAKGQKSPVKWIDDIRIPNQYEYPLTYWANGSCTGKFHPIYIRFYVDTSKLPSDVVAYRIVRAIRTQENSTVYDCGIASRLVSYDGDSSVLYIGNFKNNKNKINISENEALSFPVRYVDVNFYVNFYANFISPESAYFPDWRGHCEQMVFYSTFKYPKFIVTRGQQLANGEANISCPIAVPIIPYCERHTVSNIQSSYFVTTPISDDPVTTPFPGIKLGPYSCPNKQGWVTYSRGKKHSSFIFKGSTVSGTISNSDLDHPAYAVRKVLIYPYGGPSKTAKENTKYIPCSDIIPKAQTYVDVYEGDTYIGIFEYMFATDDENIPADHRQPIAVQTLVESRINLWYKQGFLPSFYDTGSVKNSSDKVNVFNTYKNELSHWVAHEIAGAYPVDQDKLVYLTQTVDMYKYNTVYSNNDSRIYVYPKLSLQSTLSKFGSRILHTSKKYNNSISDTWSKININNFIDLDNKFGKIIKLVENKIGLTAFQETGVSLVPIEERTMLTDNNNNRIVTGSSGVFERYEYLTKQYGIKLPNHAIDTDSGIYFIDSSEKSIIRIRDNFEIISITKGISKMFKSESFVNDNIGLLYNDNTKEVFFTINWKSYLFNENLDRFVSKLDSEYHFGINVDKFCFGVLTDLQGYNFSSFYVLDAGLERCYETRFSKEYSYSSRNVFYLKFVHNPKNSTLNRIDAILIEGRTVPKDYANIATSIYIRNDYQSDAATVPSNEIQKRFRTWRANLFRNDKSRLIDYFHTVELYFNSQDDVRLEILKIFIDYMPVFNR